MNAGETEIEDDDETFDVDPDEACDACEAFGADDGDLAEDVPEPEAA